MTKQEFASKYAVWCLGKVIPTDVREVESFMLRFLKEKKVKSVEIKQVINRDDYPNAEEIANEISNRYNNFERMKEAIEAQMQIIEALISSKRIVNLDESIAYYKQLLESIK